MPRAVSVHGSSGFSPLATALASLSRARNLANGAALQADVQYWHDQIDPLQRLADVQSYTAVNP
jgi:hypothetical protein